VRTLKKPCFKGICYFLSFGREEPEKQGKSLKMHIEEQKDYIRKLEEKHKKQKEIKAMENGRIVFFLIFKEKELFKLKRFKNIEGHVRQVKTCFFSIFRCVKAITPTWTSRNTVTESTNPWTEALLIIVPVTVIMLKSKTDHFLIKAEASLEELMTKRPRLKGIRKM